MPKVSEIPVLGLEIWQIQAVLIIVGSALILRGFLKLRSMNKKIRKGEMVGPLTQIYITRSSNMQIAFGSLLIAVALLLQAWLWWGSISF